MAILRSLILSSIVLLGLSCSALAQLRNTAPETIRQCYRNATALNRATRQPMHMDNLIAIIRKLEKKTNYEWNNRRISRTLINRFQFDGMTFDPDKAADLQYSPDPHEVIKTQILQTMIPSEDIFPVGALDNDEWCALHWMMSFSLNATRRDDQESERYGRLLAKRATNVQTTKRPLESGVVYTRWGDVSVGRVIGGIAAALEPGDDIPVVYTPSVVGGSGSGYPDSGTGGNYPGNSGNYPGSSGSFPGNSGSYPGSSGINPQFPGSSNGNGQWNNPSWGNSNSQWTGRRKKRQTMSFASLKNKHVATLAGDIGQSAIYNAPYSIDGRPLPDGLWNDTICPREFILNALPEVAADVSHDHDTWTYMTASEVRGGMDGLILGSVIVDLTNRGYKLSEILEMYYSETGIVGETGFRSCERASLYSGRVDVNELREQARSFAYYYNKKVREIPIDDQNPSVFENLVNKAFQKVTSLQETARQCVSRPPSSGSVEVPDRDKLVKPMGKFYAVIDNSVTLEEVRAQQRLVAKLAFDLDVSPSGSRLGLVDSRTGTVTVSPNFTDNAAILACKILGERLYPGQATNLVQVLKTLKSELQRVRDEEQRVGTSTSGVGNGIAVLVFVQGQKLQEGQSSAIIDVLEEYRDEFGDTQVLYVSSKYQKADFDNFVLDSDANNFVQIQPQGSGNLSDSSALFTKELLKNVQGKLYYPRCDRSKNPTDEEELLQAEHIFVTPNTIQFHAISPDYFYRSIDLRLRFTSDNGKARICWSRETPNPTLEREDIDPDIDCYETSGTYEAPESKRADVELTITKPCKGRKRSGCTPIYLSITPTSFSAAGAVGPECSTFGCESPDQVKVTWTHYGMTCGGLKNAISVPAVFLTALLSILYKFNFV